MVLVPSSVAPRPSTCLLLKRREVAEVERALQRQQEVRADPSPSLSTGCPWDAAVPDVPAGVLAEDGASGTEPAAAGPEGTAAPGCCPQIHCLPQGAVQGWGWGGHGGPADPVPTPQASAARQERALQRTAEAQAQAAEQDAKAAHLHHQLAGLQRRRDRLAQHLRSLQCFHSYLQDVLARMGQFQDVPSMLAHFEALLALRAALAQEAEAGQERLARGWAQLRGYREETLSELLCIATEEAQHHMCLEAAHREVLQGESCWAHAQSTATEKTLVLAQIKLAVLNLFHLATVPLKIHTDVALEDTEAQLDTVLLCMQDLAAICAELRPRQPGPCPAVTSVASQGYQGATEP
ncbi:cilia- and flagella-associated protein 73 isoform X1 [Melopsittacus undulatus]|uniref:cilia- and flagella-associated protein 73 isoform X1 n=1 Tax=Melopsittacus undulatus TaxID=13146 RepID=UPI00146C4FD9|nr:cilia- and flagella-associated protein 73 isoform X1 [Melopsittacus undulatus]